MVWKPRVTVAVVAALPEASEIEAAATVTVNVGVSSSVTSMVRVPSTWPAALAVIVTVWVPSMITSSTASMSKLTEV